MATASRGRLQFRLLGPLEVCRDGEPLRLGGERQRALLALLLVHANELVRTEALVDQLFGGERSASVVNAARVAVSRLRRVLEGGEERGVIETRPGGYMLNAEAEQLDVAVFERRLREARGLRAAGDAGAAVARLREALALWRGAPLADVALVDYLQIEIRRLEELRLLALMERIDADLVLGAGAELIEELEPLIASNPLQERLRGQLMLALYRAGRQAHALEVYQRTRAHLAGQLGLEPGPALRILQAQILEHDPALHAAGQREPAASADVHAEDARLELGRRAASLPLPTTTTIGRAQEVESVCALLGGGDARLVTLTGPGGVGKTRLALSVAHAIGSAFPDARPVESSLADGARWVELAGVARSEDVASTVVRALGLTPRRGETTTEALRDYLATKRLLLVVDNFEHVLDAAVLVADLLSACPGLRVLATSREPLQLGREQQFAVPLLEPNHAVELFAARARAVAPGAIVDRDVAGAICERLDRLPLAIELAAARTKMLSPSEILDRLERRLPVTAKGPRDAPERQRTLNATIDWSYELMTVGEQRLFARLAVFAGGCTLAPAQTVGKADLDTLQALVDRSVVRREGTRYSMLMTIREYALGRLDESGEGEEVRRAHAQWLVELIEAEQLPYPGWPDAKSLAILAPEQENLTAALEWASRTGRSEILARLAGRLVGVWVTQGRLHEADRWMKRVLDDQETHSGRLAAEVLSAAATLAFNRGSNDRAVALGRRALEYWQEVGDVRAIGMTLVELGAATGNAARHPPDERAVYEQAIQFARDNALTDILAGGLANLADLVLSTGSLSEGRVLCEEGRAVAPPGSGARDIAVLNLAYIEIVEGRPAKAEQLVREAFESALARGDLLVVAFAAIHMSWALAEQGRLRWSARLIGAGLGFLQTAGATTQWMDDACEAAVSDILHRELDADTVEALLAEGRDRALEAVVRDALNDSRHTTEFDEAGDRSTVPSQVIE